MAFVKCIVLCIRHHSNIRNSFIALNIPCASPVHLSPPPLLNPRQPLTLLLSL